jgi:hypothetical protein
MKKLLPILFILTFFSKSKAQVVFCPPGAEWHYRFFPLPTASVTNYVNVSIKYVRDSIVGSDTAKVLSHKLFYISCNPNSGDYLTLIKQKGDTVFFKNKKTQNTWQILYNFACTSGNGWQTTIQDNSNTLVTYTTVLSSVSYETINGFNLKKMHIGTSYSVTERLGWNYFLFSYAAVQNCHGLFYYDRLCYQDNSFGTIQFSEKPCNFSGIDGIEEFGKNSLVNVYPNPVSGVLTIEVKAMGPKESYLKITDILGAEKRHTNCDSLEGKINVDLSDLTPGIYFLQLFDKGKLVATEKIIKQ